MRVDSTLSKEVLKVLAVLAGLYLVWSFRYVALIILSAFVVTIVLMPFVRVLKKVKLPAFLAMLIPLSVFAALLVLVITYAVPAVRDEAHQFAENLPSYVEQLPLASQLDLTTESVQGVVQNQLGDPNEFIFALGTTAIKVGFGLLSVLVISMYWMSSYDTARQTLIGYLSGSKRKRSEDIWDRIESKLGRWFVGQVMVSAVIAGMVYLTITAIGMPYAGIFASLAFILEFIPVAGPIAASIPAILVAMSNSVESALFVALAYLVIQQIESHLVTPMLMGKAVKLHPIIIIVAFLIGSLSFGILGALLAVPSALIVSAFVDSFHGENPPDDLDAPLIKTNPIKKIVQKSE